MNEAKEPRVQYQQPDFEIFTNFKDENEASALAAGNLSPEDHLIHANKIIQAIYQLESDIKKRPYYEITFKIIDGYPV